MRKGCFKAATLQFEVSPDAIDLNFRKAEGLVKSIIEDFGQIDLVVFPEYAWTAYADPKTAQDIPDGKICRKLTNFANEYSTHIVAGSMVEKDDNGSLHLTSILVDRRGSVVGKHRKISLVGAGKQVRLGGRTVVGMKDELGAGIEPGKSVEPIKSELGNVGLLLGADLDTPEAARTLALKGAELLISPVSFERQWVEDIEVFGRARAYENSAYVIISNRSGEWNSPEGHLIYGGGSAIFSPMGEIVSSAGTRSTSSYALSIIDLEYLRNVRESFGMLSLRHPGAYDSGSSM
jgi:predicted amidohydrolase